VEVGVKSEVVELEGVGSGGCGDEDVGGEGAAEGDGVTIGVAVSPDGGDALDDGVARGDGAFASAVEGEGHGADAGLGGDEEETGEDGDANLERLCLFALVVLPESKLHVGFGGEILLDEVVPPCELQLHPGVARQDPRKLQQPEQPVRRRRLLHPPPGALSPWFVAHLLQLLCWRRERRNHGTCHRSTCSHA